LPEKAQNTRLEELTANSPVIPNASSRAKTSSGDSKSLVSVNQKSQRSAAEPQSIKANKPVDASAFSSGNALSSGVENPEKQALTSLEKDEITLGEKGSPMTLAKNHPVSSPEQTQRPLAHTYPEFRNRESAKSASKTVNPLNSENQAESFFRKDTMQKLTVLQRYIINPINLERKLVSDTISLEKIALSGAGGNTSTNQEGDLEKLA